MKYWEGVYYEFQVGPDGEPRRSRKLVFVGHLTDLRTEEEAHRKLDEILAEINAQDYQPRSIVTLRDFINNTYIPVILKTKNPQPPGMREAPCENESYRSSVTGR